MQATSDTVTDVSGSRVLVVTLKVRSTFLGSDTLTSRFVTRGKKSLGAFADLWSVYTSSVQSTGIVSTSITVVADSSSEVAGSLAASGDGAVVWSNTLLLSDATDTCNVAAGEAGSLWLGTCRNFLFASSSGAVASKGDTTSGGSLAGLWNSQASQFSIAKALFALVGGSTDNRGFYNTLLWVANCSAALVDVCKQDGGDIVEDTLTSLWVARVSGANVVVIASFQLVDALSSVVIATVDGTCVLVVTLDLGEHTFTCGWIARVGGTCISIVTGDLLLDDALSSS